MWVYYYIIGRDSNMLYILGICSAVLGVIEYLSADDRADQIKGLLLIIMAIIITH